MITKKGARVVRIDALHESSDADVSSNGGGRASGEAGLKGMSEPAPGNILVEGIRLSCCRVAKSRKWSVT